MAYQIYGIGEWERVGGVDGYSTIRAYLQPGLRNPCLCAQEVRSPRRPGLRDGDGSFEVVAVGESPFDQRRPSLAAWWAAHPQFLDPDNCPF
jgi:hypothetical protein